MLGLALGLLCPPGSAVVRGDAAGAPGVLRATLDNGLRVVVVKNTLAPVVTTELTYLVGSTEAPPGFPGMAHALEHMMFRGSPDLSADQLASIAAAMGGVFDASTQQRVTQYVFTVPADGFTKPHTADSSVDLPSPLVPSNATISPRETWKSTPNSTFALS